MPVDTAPTGMLVVVGADPANEVLRMAYDEIVRTSVVPDPQSLPESILSRRDAVAPERIVDAAIWPALIRARADGTDRDAGYEGIGDALRHMART